MRVTHFGTKVQIYSEKKVLKVMRVTHFEQKCKIYSEKKVSKSDDSYTLWSIRGKDKDKQMSKSDHSYTKGATTTTNSIWRVMKSNEEIEFFLTAMFVLYEPFYTKTHVQRSTSLSIIIIMK